MIIPILAAALASAPLSDEVTFAGWKVVSLKDSMTDKTEVHAVLKTDNGKLTFLCSPGDPRDMIIVDTTDYLGGRGDGYRVGDVVYRIDDAAPVTDTWKYSDSQAVAIGQGKVAKLLAAISGAGRIQFRFTTYDRHLIDVSFAAAGAADALAEAKRRCLR